MTTRGTASEPLPFDPSGSQVPPHRKRRLANDVDLRSLSTRQQMAAKSALWAAWADATGWISELTDAKGLRRRTKGRHLDEPMPWTRKIGGRAGVTVDLPSGTYSDDTQLRLAVCRSYGPRGFDPETFSEVELTVWPSYALGGGTGTKAAAASMLRTGSRWSANRPPSYHNAGGNGAAMRSQPHAWHSPRSVPVMLTDVMRDAVSTHGHPFGLVGAALSALAVADSMPDGECRIWHMRSGWLSSFLSDVALLAEVAENDPELYSYWLPNWTHPELGSWPEALGAAVGEGRRLSRLVEELVASSTSLTKGYAQIVDALDLRVAATRGSGLHTTVGAIGLCGLSIRHGCAPNESLVEAANALHTDTDTIATMAAAILGCRAGALPPGSLLDAEYIASEAARVAAEDRPGASAFVYPDLLRWEPPKTQADAVSELDGKIYISGFGQAQPLTVPMESPNQDFAWQWMRLETTQTVLIKRRVQLPIAKRTNLPTAPAPEAPQVSSSGEVAYSPMKRMNGEHSSADSRHVGSKESVGGSASDELNRALGLVRSSKYDVHVIGSQLSRLAIDGDPSIAAVFGALIANELAAL